ncbi:MAG: T9SS type A sorting domain-containing protein [bacterium]|nr:T9SS type A sorting domain-containing protein [bacterium]
MLFVRADTLGENPRVRVFAGSDWEECGDAIRLSAERTLIVGGAHNAAGGAWDMFALMTNDAGDSLWSRRYGTTANDYALAVTATTDRDSGFVLAGWSEGLVPGERRGLLMQISATGDSLWTLDTPEAAASELADVMQDGAWRYHAAGYVDREPHHGCYLLTEPDPHSPEPHAPSRFSLLAPADDAVVDSHRVTFAWEAAFDPDEHDTVRYTLELAFDTTFATSDIYGPLDTTRFVWTADTDEVPLFWRVTAEDLLGNTRLCRDGRRGFRMAIPDSLGAFSLFYPDSGMGLPRTASEFRWERALDADADDTVRYAIQFMVGDTGFTFPGLPDTFINVSFAGNPLIGEADTVWWQVTAQSLLPPMERDSREVWSFVTWSVGADEFLSLPLEFALDPPFPNPFNAVTRIRYGVDRLESVRLDVFDLQGRRVTTLADGMHTPGRYECAWNATDRASGTYFVRLAGADRARTAKLILLK